MTLAHALRSAALINAGTTAVPQGDQPAATCAASRRARPHTKGTPRATEGKQP